MKYFINGDEVSEETFDRDNNDNFNVGIQSEIIETETETHMNYEA